jgi:hypothetical protein
VKPYIGQWLKVSGAVTVVSTVSASGRDSVYMTMAVKNADGELLYVVLAMFRDQRWMDRALTFKLNDKVTMLGKLTEVKDGGIVLEQCEIVE